MERKRLGEMLLEAGIIDETQLQAALGHQRRWGGRLGQALVDLRLASEAQIVNALSRKFGYEVVALGSLTRTPQLKEALRLVPGDLAMRQLLFPISSDAHSLTVAMADPSNIAVVDELSFRTGRRIRIVLAGDREIAAAVRHFYFPEERAQQFAPIPLDETPHAVPLQADSFAVHPGRSASRGPASGAMAEGASIEQAPLVGRRDMPPLVSLATDTEEFLLREPVLATDLAPAEEDAIQVQGQPPPQQVPKAQALEGALKSTVQGDDFAAALARLLVRRGVITLEELLGELNRKQ